MSHFERVAQNRHGNGVQMMVFMDGTARTIGLKELWTFKWNRDYDTEGRWTVAGGASPEDWPEWMQHYKEY